MEKVIRDGKVAVLVSPGFGAGWYSWNSHKELLFHPKLIEMVEAKRNAEIDEDWIKENLGLEHVYTGGAGDLEIQWVPQGTAFKIDEYDGSESLETMEHLDLIA